MSSVAETNSADLTAANVAWDLEPLLDDQPSVDSLIDQADEIADELAQRRGQIATLDAAGLESFMREMATLHELIGRAGSYAGLRFSVNVLDHEIASTMQRVEERSTAIATKLIFFELEWAAVPQDHVDAVLADDRLVFARHHLRSIRRFREHLLTEPEERILTEKSVTGSSAWSRLFEEQTSTITLELPEPDGSTRTTSLEEGLTRLQHPDREVRQAAASAVTDGLASGLRTRAFIFNTLLNDKAIDDRMRKYPTWISARNLANEASDESVQALVSAVERRYDIPQRWYRLKARILGLPKIADYDRMASIAQTDARIGWTEATNIVLDSYASFSTELADIVKRFYDESWIDAPLRPGKRPGAFCAYTVPSHHPYLLLNWTSRTRDVLTLAHELGHGLHAYLARGQGVFHQGTSLTLAETASVFGETVTNGRLLAMLDDPNEKLALLASILEDSIATVFRQTAMNRFEHSVHTARRDEGELSVDRFGELWAGTQTAMLGDAVEVTDGYRTWWSYIPHFISTPGYVYAYAYGQLLALSVYRRYEEGGEAFVPSYLQLLRAGGSMPPEELGHLVGCDLSDPGFWDGGLDIIEAQLHAAEQAATAAGRG
ncbi:MAG TPA: M3 family oligoendopeptidase [Acidimicrobiales bacterium]|nr:M3 family oligoendopeptidase [Acidimicrobiales bacterium]